MAGVQLRDDKAPDRKQNALREEHVLVESHHHLDVSCSSCERAKYPTRHVRVTRLLFVQHQSSIWDLYNRHLCAGKVL